MSLLLCVILSVLAVPAEARDLERVVVSVPGPRNLSYLPIDLIPRIDADQAEGLKVELMHTGGGAVALNNLVTRNADFAVAGVPAAMSLRANGGDVVILAPVDDAPLFVLMVRSGLRGEVTRIADLRGKVIGVNTSTRSSKTTSQQLMELVLKSGGVPLDTVRIVPAGQTWEEQSSLLITGAADAVMGDEPFASRLLKDGKVFFLANLARPETVRNIPGTNFLHAALETRSELIEKHPQKVERMVNALRRSLQWIASHRPEEVVDRLGVTDRIERESLVQALRDYPRAFSKDGRFSTAQLEDTDRFFHSGNANNPKGLALRIESMTIDRWAGRGK
ncbi:MAG: ABC transporter substrate-binding protein [Gammaproteobacteria bacterium]|nr:ABC transporter substrate-binding protein [Gammaproteobacteria bacterium]